MAGVDGTPRDEGDNESVDTSKSKSASNYRSGMSIFLRRRLLNRIDSIVERLTDYQVLKGRPAQITESEICNVCLLANDSFMEDPVCLDIHLKRPLYIIGDLFGQYGDLLRIFNVLGHPPESRYLFLGNYVDRGERSIEVLTLLFCYKITYPTSVYLLRGNHECRVVSYHFGFQAECRKRYGPRLWKNIVNTFEHMPIVAIVDDTLFCVHSGLSPGITNSTLRSKSQLLGFFKNMITRPTDVYTNTLVTHLLWSEPDSSISGWDQNPSGLAYLYGEEVVADFCDRFNFQQVIRSNEVYARGYEFFKEPRLLTIFTAPNYRALIKNKGAIIHLKKSLQQLEIKGRLKLIAPIMGLRNKKTGRMNITITDCNEGDDLDGE